MSDDVILQVQQKVTLKAKRKMPLRRKLLKTSDTKEHSVHTNLESCNIQIGSEKNSIYCKTNYSDITTYIIIISFTYSYIVDISSYFLLVSYAIIL